MSARFEPTALARQHVSFSHSGLALQRKSYHHLRRPGFALVGRRRDDLLKC
jgi:hypothetical protein